MVLSAGAGLSRRVDSSSSGVVAFRGKSRNDNTRQKASAMMRRTRLSGAAGVRRA